MKYLFSLGLACLLWACSSNETSESIEISGNEFSIEGSFIGNNEVILGKVTPQRLVPVDTTDVDSTTGEFNMVYTTESPRFFTLVFGDGNSIMLLAKPGEKIRVDYDSTVASRYTVSGSKGSELIRETNILLDETYAKINTLESDYQGAFEDPNADMVALRKSYESKLLPILEEHREIMTAFIQEHKGSPVTIMALYQRIGRMPIFDIQKNFDVFEMVAEGLKQSQPTADFTTDIVNRVEQARPTSIGQKATDFSLPNPDGNMVSLSDFEGKVVLVDFWASWCKPCRAENPNIVEAYNKYKDQGFTVLGVSLDGVPNQEEPRLSWLEAIQKDNLTWTHISDLQGWSTPVREIYQFSGIPHSILVGKDGTILAKNLRGAELHQTLEEVL